MDSGWLIVGALILLWFGIESLGLKVVVVIATAAFLIWLSPWLLISIAAAGIIKGCDYQAWPNAFGDPLKRVAWCTIWAALPVGIAGLLLTTRAQLLPSDAVLWLMLRTYDAHHWLDEQIWLKPKVLIPVIGLAGIVSFITVRSAVIGHLGRFIGLSERIALSLYALSLFSFIAPGPFELKLDEATAEMRSRLRTELAYLKDAEKRYLAKNAVLVALKDADVVESVREVLRDAETLRQRLGCKNAAEPSGGCQIWPNFPHLFGDALPDIPKPPVHSEASLPQDLPALQLATITATGATSRVEARIESVKATTDALIGSLTDLLPFGGIANSVIGDVAAAVALRFGDALIARSPTSIEAMLAPENVDRVVADIPHAIREAAATIHDKVAHQGIWVLFAKPGTSDADLAKFESRVKEFEARLPPGTTLDVELHRRIEERRPSERSEILKEIEVRSVGEAERGIR